MEKLTVLELIDIFSRLGLGTACLFAVLYLVKHRDKIESKRDEEVKGREERLIQSLDAKDIFIQTTLIETSEKSTAAMHHIASAVEGLPCRNLRETDQKTEDFKNG